MMIPNNISKNERYVYSFCLIITSAIILYNIIKLCFCGIVDFDGGMNLQIPYQLIKNGTYSTTYNGGTMFDTRIQTGIPVLLPTAFIFLILGVGPLQGIIANGIYLLGMFFFIYLISLKLKINKWLLLLLEMFICITPNLSTYGMRGYGEIPAFFWLLTTIYMLLKTEQQNKNLYFFLSGIFYGFAFLTKTVILIALPSLLLVLFSKCFIEKQIKIRQLLIWILGFFIPILSFELFKITQLGIIPYINTQEHLIQDVGRQAGIVSGFKDTPGITNKFLIHIQSFCSQYHIYLVILVLILSINFIYFIARVIKQRKLEYFDIIILIAFSYFGWWLLITSTEKAWARRILIGVILMELVTAFTWNAIYKNYKNRYLNICLFFSSVICSLIACCQTKYINDFTKKDILEASEFIKNYVKENPDSIVCGADWYQAPVISIMAEIPFYDINGMKENFSNIILVEDQYAYHSTGFADVKKLYEYDEIYSNKRTPISIYQINYKHPYRPFDDNDWEAVKQTRYIYTNEYEYIRGVHSYEKSGDLRWASKNVGTLLKTTDNPQYLNFQFKVAQFESMPEEDCIMQIFIDGVLLHEQQITDNGEYALKIDLDNKVEKEQTAEIYIKTNFSFEAPHDAREMSYRIISLEFL